MTQTKPAPSSRKKYLIPFASAAAAMLFGATIFILPPPTTSYQLHTTTSGQYEQVFVGPNIRIDMNTNSSMTVSSDQPPEIELLQGNLYVDITNSSANTSKLVVIVNEARIKNIGTQFSVTRQNDGGSVAVSDGQVEIQISTQSHLIQAGHQVTFDSTQITEETPITKANIAPWR